jgi:hypothetical protein
MPEATNTPTTSPANAELIRLCAEVVAVQNKINAMQHGRLDLIEAAAVPPATLAVVRILPDALTTDRGSLQHVPHQSRSLGNPREPS